MNIPYIMPAAGWLRTPEDIRDLADLDTVSEIVAGSFTRLARAGNKEPTFVEIEPGSYVNSKGMPNGGLDYLRSNINTMIDASGDKPLRISIAPIKLWDLSNMTAFLYGTDISTIELNVGCPNIWKDGKRHSLISHDPSALRRAMYEVIGTITSTLRKQIAVKLSPLPDNLIDEIVGILHTLGIDEIVTMNTRPDYDTKDILSMPTGGLSGKKIQMEAVRQVEKIRTAMDKIGSKMRLVGVGGIDSGIMLKRHIEAGVDAIQIGTHTQVFGKKVFAEILSEYFDLV